MKKERKQSRIVLFAVILVFSMLSVISFTASVATALPCTCGDVCVNETGWWCDGGAFNPSGTPIQAAIDNASVCCGTFSCASPCVICVKDGTYTENVDVTTANLVIKSENGADSTTVQAANVGDAVFDVTANVLPLMDLLYRVQPMRKASILTVWISVQSQITILQTIMPVSTQSLRATW